MLKGFVHRVKILWNDRFNPEKVRNTKGVIFNLN